MRLAIEALQFPRGRRLTHHIGPALRGIGIVPGHAVMLSDLTVKLLAKERMVDVGKC